MSSKVNDKSWRTYFHREIGDESNPTYSIVVSGPSYSLHVIDPLNAGTDFNVSATTVPTLFIHGSATCPTEYVKIYTDETDGHFDVAGGNALIGVPSSGDVTLQVDSTDEYVFDATTANFKNNALGSLGTTTFLGQINVGSQIISGAGNLLFVTGKSITGTGLSIDGGGTATKYSNSASWVAGSAGTAYLLLACPAGAGTLTSDVWLKFIDDVGSLRYIPAWRPV